MATEYRITPDDGEPEDFIGPRTLPMGVDIPSIIEYLQRRYSESRNSEEQSGQVQLFAKTFDLPANVSLGILCREVTCVTEGDTVVVQWPEDLEEEDS